MAINGEVGQLPDGKHIDQISKVISQIKNTPDSRRMIVSAWNVGEIGEMALPLVCLFSILCSRRKTILPTLSKKQIYFWEFLLILPLAPLTMMVAVCDLKVGELHIPGDAHITVTTEQTELQLSRDPRPLPKMTINPSVKSIFVYIRRFSIGRLSTPHIKGKVAV